MRHQICLSYVIIVDLVICIITVSSESATCSGDIQGVVKGSQTCSELVTAANYECYNTTIENSCCASCNAVATSDANCKYGDSTTCFSFLCASLVDPSVCCDTCRTTTTTTTTASTTTTAPSTTTTPITTTTTASTTTTTTTPPTTSTAATTTTTPTTTTTTAQTTTTATTTTTLAPATTSTAAATTSISSLSTSNSVTSSSRESHDGDGVDIDVVVGAVCGSVAVVLSIIAAVIIAVKLYKRQQRKIQPLPEELPSKPDLYSTPTRPELYSTPTMVVINTREDTFEGSLSRKESGGISRSTIESKPHEKASDVNRNSELSNGHPVKLDKETPNYTDKTGGRVFDKRPETIKNSTRKPPTEVSGDRLAIQELSEQFVDSEQNKEGRGADGIETGGSDAKHAHQDGVTMTKERQESVFRFPTEDGRLSRSGIK